MKPKLVVLLFSAALLSLPMAAHADDLSEKLSHLVLPGQWKSTATIDMSVIGTNMELPSRTTTNKHCIKKDDFDELAAPDMEGMDCEMTRKELTGNTLHIGMTCSGSRGEFTMNGQTIFTSKTANKSHFVMHGKMSGMKMKIVVDGSSKRIGDCTGGSDED